LRARSFAVLQTNAVSFSAVQSVSSRFRDPNYGYRAVDLVPASFDPSPLATDGPLPYPVYPNLIYPPGSSINTDFQNNGEVAAHFYILYHGVKLFGQAEQAYTYPAACRMMDFTYTLSIPSLAVGETRTDNIKTIRQDADFALDSAYVCTKQQPGQAAQGNFTNLFVQVLDHLHRRQQPLAILVATVVMLGIAHAMLYGVQAALISELFATRLRYSGASLAYQLAGPFAGGLAPIVATSLAYRFPGSYAPLACYIVLLAIISSVCVHFLGETAHKDIRG
jgi:multisubunit Na+/H+ antiporter MnhC subunit